MNKYTHISEKYLDPCPQTFYNMMKEIIQISKTVIDELLLLEYFVIPRLKQKIDSEVYEYLNNNLPDELSILANNCIIEEMRTETITIEDINEINISIFIEGYICVSQEYGKGEDYTTIDGNYPFSVPASLSVVDPKIIEIYFHDMDVDNSSWFGE
ncbi:hypothetical protein RHO13_01715 [Orbus wheelerorum]|uniref:pPIWI-associating nuclease domain-containing protein n=1 Tax=Orbus wheelerorum TaxID=3074111 RepID=UPI00370D1BCE